MQINNIEGYLQTKIISYLLNLRQKQKDIYLSRHGESQFNTQDRVGGDSDLSEKGIKYPP